MNKMRFDRKLRLFLLMVILPTTLIVLFTATWSSVASIGRKSRALMQTQIAATANDVSARLTRYRDLSVAFMLDANIRAYLELPDPPDALSRTARVNGVRNSLNSFSQVDSGIRFLVVIKRWPDVTVFRGLPSPWFADNYEPDKAQSQQIGYGDMRISRSNIFSGGAEEWAMIYAPIYAPHMPARQTGELCICVADNLIGAGRADAQIQFETSLMSADAGAILSATSGTAAPDAQYKHFSRLMGDSGSFEADGSLFVYQKAGRWNFYVVGETKLIALYGDSIGMAAWLVGLILLFVVLSLVAGSRMVRRMYASLEQLRQGMDRVSRGDFGARLVQDGADEDFRTIYGGFNDMTGRIAGLMDKVKTEERHIEQIRFNALQAQIHPHFLYNTLDCIRWMASAHGAADIVSIIKALSQYYRTSLSQGRDVITLSEEIDLTKNYLVIQNIRYEDMIHCTFDIPPGLSGCMIPKLTLQPLVENYVNHAFDSTDADGMIRVQGRIEGGDAIIEVIDNGGVTGETIARMNDSLGEEAVGIGYGIRNVHQRIRILCGPEYGLRFSLNELGGVTARIRLPLMMEGSAKTDVHIADRG